ncbi:MAG: NmrA family NAD(P)-binding protein [Holophaga sp.]|jgi:uncharacterized protein YbjT (DUF2867 family)
MMEKALGEAARGVDGVFHINPAFAPNDAELGIAMVHAAMASGVRKLVFSLKRSVGPSKLGRPIMTTGRK